MAEFILLFHITVYSLYNIHRPIPLNRHSVLYRNIVSWPYSIHLKPISSYKETEQMKQAIHLRKMLLLIKVSCEKLGTNSPFKVRHPFHPRVAAEHSAHQKASALHSALKLHKFKKLGVYNYDECWYHFQ